MSSVQVIDAVVSTDALRIAGFIIAGFKIAGLCTSEVNKESRSGLTRGSGASESLLRITEPVSVPPSSATDTGIVSLVGAPTIDANTVTTALE